MARGGVWAEIACAGREVHPLSLSAVTVPHPRGRTPPPRHGGTARAPVRTSLPASTGRVGGAYPPRLRRASSYGPMRAAGGGCDHRPAPYRCGPRAVCVQVTGAGGYRAMQHRTEDTPRGMAEPLRFPPTAPIVASCRQREARPARSPVPRGSTDRHGPGVVRPSADGGGRTGATRDPEAVGWLSWLLCSSVSFPCPVCQEIGAMGQVASTSQHRYAGRHCTHCPPPRANQS